MIGSYADLLYSKTRKELNEHSLTRVHQHFLNSKKNSFAILTSWHNDEEETPESLQKNKEDFQKLKSILSSNKLGYFHLSGHWKKNDPDTTQEKIFKEPSVFIVGISFDLTKKLLSQFKQQAVIYSGPETDGNAVLIRDNGSFVIIGKFSPNKIADSFSKLKGGRSFVFEYSQPGSWGAAMAKQFFEKENGGPLDVNKLLDE